MYEQKKSGLESGDKKIFANMDTKGNPSYLVTLVHLLMNHLVWISTLTRFTWAVLTSLHFLQTFCQIKP